MSIKRARVPVAVFGTLTTATVGLFHEHMIQPAILCGVIALCTLLWAVAEFFNHEVSEPPTEAGGRGGAGGSASVGGSGTATGGQGGRGGDVRGRSDV